MEADPHPRAAGPRGSAAPGTSVSTSRCVSGGGGQRPRPCRLLSPGIHRCFACPSAPATTPEGTPRPGRPGAPGRAAPAQDPEAQSPPLRPAPSVGLGPEGGSREGRETGSSPPSPSPVPARDLRGPPRPQACLSAQAHATRRGSHWEEPRPRAQHLRTPSPPRARRQPVPTAAARARGRAGRMRPQRRFPFLTFGGAGVKKGKEK